MSSFKGPELEVGSTYETFGGLTYLVLSPPVQCYTHMRSWRTLVLIGIDDRVGPQTGVWMINEDSGYHQYSRRL